MPLAPDMQEKFLNYVGITGAVMEKVAAAEAVKAEQDAKIAALIPQAVQALLDNERIEPHQKEAAEAALRDPVKVLEILTKTAQHRNDAERAAIGRPAPQQVKKASAPSTKTVYVGDRSADESTKESNLALMRGLGLA